MIRKSPLVFLPVSPRNTTDKESLAMFGRVFPIVVMLEKQFGSLSVRRFVVIQGIVCMPEWSLELQFEAPIQGLAKNGGSTLFTRGSRRFVDVGRSY